MLNSRRFSTVQQLQDASNDAPPLRLGAEGPGVVALQDALADLNYKLTRSYAKLRRADGIYGEETAAAVRSFQQSAGITPDGRAGTETLGRLDRLICSTPGLDYPDPNVLDRERRADAYKPCWLRNNLFW